MLKHVIKYAVSLTLKSKSTSFVAAILDFVLHYLPSINYPHRVTKGSHLMVEPAILLPLSVRSWFLHLLYKIALHPYSGMAEYFYRLDSHSRTGQTGYRQWDAYHWPTIRATHNQVPTMRHLNQAPAVIHRQTETSIQNTIETLQFIPNL